MKHLVIPDIQAKDGVPLEHLTWIGKYIVDKKPDVIICIGDFADMPSLSSYDKGKKSFEGRRYKKDIAAARLAMDLLLAPLKAYQNMLVENHKIRYKPRMILTLGNHEERIMRAVDSQAEYDGLISYMDLPYEDWDVIDYLKPIVVDGVTYVHFLANPMTGKPYGGSTLNMLNKVGTSFFMGHKQTLDVATRFTLEGKQQWGIIAGSCYLHDEDYKGYQGNHHWRGVVMLHDVCDGSFDPMFVSLKYLKERYS